jgi:hypothetical protein
VKKSQRISKFERQYEIFDCFYSLYKFISSIKQDSSDLDTNKDMPNYLVVMNAVIDDFDLLDGKHYSTESRKLGELARKGGEEGKRADLDSYFFAASTDSRLHNLKNRSLSIIGKGRFFFETQLIDMMNLFINELFNYIAVFQDGSGQENPRDASLVLDVVDELVRVKIIEKLERDLYLQ